MWVRIYPLRPWIQKDWNTSNHMVHWNVFRITILNIRNIPSSYLTATPHPTSNPSVEATNDGVVRFWMDGTGDFWTGDGSSTFLTYYLGCTTSFMAQPHFHVCPRYFLWKMCQNLSPKISKPATSIHTPWTPWHCLPEAARIDSQTDRLAGQIDTPRATSRAGRVEKNASQWNHR